MESSPPSVPKAADLLHLCSETIRGLKLPSGSEGYLMNRQQCGYLVKRLFETDEFLQQSPLGENASLALQELHQVLLCAKSLIEASYISTTPQLLRTTIEQRDMKETFSKLLYDIRWHVIVLKSILVDNFGNSLITFEPEMCDVQLSDEEKLILPQAQEEDERSLKDRLGSLNLEDVKLEDAIETEHLKQVLEQLKAVEDEPSSAVGESREVAKELPIKVVVKEPKKYFYGGNLIGEGAFGKVLKTNILGGKYAVKIIKCRRLDKEMPPLLQLGHHPHIVPFLCYSEDDKLCYLIMEEMQMGLHMLLNQEHKLSDVEAVDLMLQIGEGIRYIHSKNVAHRDLKPANVLVDLAKPSSEGLSSRVCSVKIADFGIAKTTDASWTCSNQTLNIGTIKYMAPEVIGVRGDRKKARYNPRKADAYSFAIMCYEILTGEDSTYGLQTDDQFGEQVEEVSNRPDLSEKCSPRLASLIQRCSAGFFFDRLLFPEICKELRYIKGLLLRGDQSKLEMRLEGILPSESTEGSQKQGPWGSISWKASDPFEFKGTYIKCIKLGLYEDGIVVLLGMAYIDSRGITLWKTIALDQVGTLEKVEVITFRPFEFITRISGYHRYVDLYVYLHCDMRSDFVGSLTIHTNCRSYGPYGREMGNAFTTDSGRIIGLFGTVGDLTLHSIGISLCSIGVFIIPSNQYAEHS